MPPRRYSRYTFTTGFSTGQGVLMLSERIPYRFRPLDDTRVVTVREGDTLWGIANRAYEGLVRPGGLWWVIADFQPEPILDPTIRLVPGQPLYVPSLRVVEEEIFGSGRRSEVET